MADVAAIKVGNDNESSFKLYPVNDEFLKRADEPEEYETIIKTTMDPVAIPGANYFLGEQAVVSVVLPTPVTVSGLKMGQTISVVFYSGANAATLNITGDTIGEVITPAANQRIEINMLWDGTYWAIVSTAMEVSADE